VLRRSTRPAFNALDIDVSAPDSLPHPCTPCTAQRPGNVDEAARLEALEKRRFAASQGGMSRISKIEKAPRDHAFPSGCAFSLRVDGRKKADMARRSRGSRRSRRSRRGGVVV